MNKWISAILLVFLPVFLKANEPLVIKLNLEAAHKHALEHNSSVKIADLNINIARHQVREVRAIGLPQVNADVRLQRYIEQPVSLIPAEFLGGQEGEYFEVSFGTDYDLNASLNVDQLLFSGPYIVALKASREFVNFSHLQKQKTEIQIKRDVSQAYFTVLVIEKNLEAVNGNIEYLSRQLLETRAMFESGFVEDIDVDRLTLVLRRIQNQKEMLERQYQQSANVLKFHTGLSLTDSLVLTESFESILEEEIEFDITQDLFKPEKRIEYRLLNNKENLSQLDMQREKAEYLPSLSAFATHRQNAQRNEFDFFDGDKNWYPSTIIGLSLKVPIFDGLRKNAKIQQLKIEQSQVRYEKEQFANSARLEVGNYHSDYLNSLESVNAEKENLNLAERILEKSLLKYNQGVGSSLEIIDAHNTYYESQLLYMSAVLDLLIARVNLKYALAE